MSRLAKNPIGVPAGVEVSIAENKITVAGKKGRLIQSFSNLLIVKHEANQLIIDFDRESQAAKRQAGTARALFSNMIQGVTDGFTRSLELIGVGYRSNIQGNLLNLTLGYSHPVQFSIPEGIAIKTPTPTEIVIEGIDKNLVGKVAAEIRRFRKINPYKGKGVRNKGEQITLKEAKKKTTKSG